LEFSINLKRFVKRKAS